MALKRLFLGSFIDPAIISALYARIRSDFKTAVSGKWVDEKKLHITHKFLGDVEESKIGLIKEALSASLDRPASCEMYFGQPSSFSLKNPRVLFISAEDKTRAIFEMNSICERSLVKIGFAAEDKSFHPHITIMRMKSVNTETFASLVNKYKEEKEKAGPQLEIRLSLIESVLTPSGPVYKIL
jgi:2'-5' RNA ligase